MRFERHIKWIRIVCLLVIALAAFSSARRMIRTTSPAKGDLSAYVNAASLMVSGGHIYEVPTHDPAQGGLYYIYPPLLAFLFIPFSFIGINMTAVVWTILSIVLLGWIVKRCYEMFAQTPFFDEPPKTRWIIGFFTILLSSRFILLHLDRGQANILEMALVVLALTLTEPDRKNSVLAGALIGFAAVLKAISLPFTILIALERNMKALAGTILGIGIGALLPAVYLGWNRNWEYLDYWFRNFVLDSGQRDAKLGPAFNLSIKATLYRFFSSSTAFESRGTRYSLTIIELPPFWIEAANWSIRAVLLGSIVVFWFRYRNLSSQVGRNAFIALLFCLTPLLFPTAQSHYFVFLLPPYLFVVYAWCCLGLKDRAFRWLVIASFIVATCTTDGLVGDFLGDVFIFSGSLIVGSLLLAGAIFRAADCFLSTSRSQTGGAEIPTSSEPLGLAE